MVTAHQEHTPSQKPSLMTITSDQKQWTGKIQLHLMHRKMIIFVITMNMSLPASFLHCHLQENSYCCCIILSDWPFISSVPYYIVLIVMQMTAYQINNSRL